MTLSLIERILNPLHWEGLIHMLADGGLPESEAFQIILGSYVELHEKPEEALELLADIELLLH